MKKTLVFAMFILVLLACSNSKKETTMVKNTQKEYASFGNNISDKNVISKEEMSKKFEGMKKGDTIAVKFASSINDVCKKKGCWMKLDLGNGKESMVRFKDYGFFMPLNSENKNVIVEGKAYVTEISVKELQHYAKDAGKTEEEIAAITSPKFTFAFEAEGVLMSE